MIGAGQSGGVYLCCNLVTRLDGRHAEMCEERFFLLRGGKRPTAIRHDSVPRHLTGLPATFTGRRIPRRSAISRSLARVVANKRPSTRPSRSLSIRFCQL